MSNKWEKRAKVKQTSLLNYFSMSIYKNNDLINYFFFFFPTKTKESLSMKKECVNEKLISILINYLISELAKKRNYSEIIS